MVSTAMPEDDDMNKVKTMYNAKILIINNAGGIPLMACDA
jgi:hypothetical protein